MIKEYNINDILSSFDMLNTIQETKEIQTDKCKKCLSLLMDTDDGLICSKCGMFNNYRICQKPEWKMGDENGITKEDSRCGIPSNPLIPSISLSCTVESNFSAAKWSKELQYISNFTKWNSVPYIEKILYDDLQYFTLIAEEHNISKKIISSTMYYHSEICKFGHQFRGNNKEGLMAASLFIACKLNNCPRTIREVAYMFNIDIKHATTGCRIAVSILKSTKANMYDELDGTINQHEVINRYAHLLKYPKEYCLLSSFMIIKINQLKLFIDKIPESIIAGTLYYISNKLLKTVDSSLTMRKQISNLVHISEATVGKCSKIIEINKALIVPPSILNK